MIFEQAKASDFEAVNHLARQVSAYHAQWDPDIQIVDYPYPMDWFQDCIKEEAIHDSVIYVARQDETVIGYIRFYLWYTNSTMTEKRTMLSIDDIGVEEGLRHQGIGTRMMDSLRILARGWGCSDLCLYVDAPNESAIGFYQKCGFRTRNIGMRMKL